MIKDKQRQIDLNLELYDELVLDKHREKFLGWSIVILFYTALQRIDVLVYDMSAEAFANHNQRMNTIEALGYCNSLKRSYRKLYDVSRRIRYNCETMTKNDLKEYLGCFNNVIAEADKVKPMTA